MAYEGDITALMVAAARAEVSGTAGFTDEFAATVVTAAGGFDVAGFPDDLVRRVCTSVLLRSRFLDDAVMKGVGDGATQVVLLGSGLDARPWRLPVPPATRFWMLDLPGTAGFTQEALGPAPVDATSVTADLRDPEWIDALVGAGFDPEQRTVWVAEGLLFYLESAIADRVAEQAAKASVPGSVFAFAHFGPGSQGETMTRSMSTEVQTYGSTFVSTIESPQEYLDGTPWLPEQVSTFYLEGQEIGRDVEYTEEPGQEVTWLCSARHEG
ncbi:class I SAM-dependent methyltransferase [Dietzia sp.]|uniref:class I SAM-dependent methyltransferase n=1 Tax=Dietzia sp. TaxID=1871616 RepID=UPI002FD8FD65